MKKIILTFLITAGLLTSCEKWIDPDMNIDPNNPSDVAVAQLLGPVEFNLAYICGGEMARWDCLWMQQLAGLQSQSANNEIYILGESDVSGAWSYNLYSPGMINTKILLEKAEKSNSPHFSGVGKILMAYHLGVTTDHWGDIPYTDALEGAKENLKPEYDTQEEIYNQIFDLLNGAITDLQADVSVFSPADEDIIYKGDLEKWIKTAYALKARYSLHLAKIKGNTAYTDALEAVSHSYQSNADDFKFIFGAAYNNSNPIYQSEQERPGYYAASSTMMNMLAANNDPRKAVYFDGEDGSIPGQPNADAAIIGEAYCSSESPVYLMSFSELKFIEAEARYKLNPSDPLAVDACNEGIKASLQREGVYGDGSWFNAHKVTAATISLENIMVQKYLSSFLQIECFTDWRRTGYPAFSIATGAVFQEIPRRLPYPDDERLYNEANMPTGVTLLTRMWWDAI
jgi:hypothetical protein